ncbi:MAG: undecaprenyl-phosphate glucose phosphotransferase [Pseudomonadota bacterium]
MPNRGILKEYSSLLNLILRVIDWLTIYFSGIFAYYATGLDVYFAQIGQHAMPITYNYVLAVAVLLSVVVFPFLSLYRAWRGGSVFEELKLLTLGWVLTAFLLATFALMTKTGAAYSRLWVGVWFISGWSALVFFRILLRLLLRWMRSKGRNLRQIVIVGAGDLGKEVAERVSAASWTGLEIVGFFNKNYTDEPKPTEAFPILGDLDSLADFVGSNSVDQVWIAMQLKDEEMVKVVLHSLRHSAVDICYIPNIFGFQLLNHSFTEIAGLPVVNLSATPMEGINRWLKAIEDQALAFIILTLVSPLMLLIAMGVKLSSKGPIFFRQERVSWNGEPFTMYKFRSMVMSAEEESGPVWAMQGESRVTWFGSLLRKSSLDELPQFINVLKGEMSIVGPRPERSVFVEQFKDQVPDYMKKHLVKAGITGWAQVNGWRGDTDLKKRVEHDIYYIEHWSVWFDLKIIMLTFLKGFVHRNAY